MRMKKKLVVLFLIFGFAGVSSPYAQKVAVKMANTKPVSGNLSVNVYKSMLDFDNGLTIILK
jgi:hypothetical protein